MSINNGNEQIFIKGREVASKKYVDTQLDESKILGVTGYTKRVFISELTSNLSSEVKKFMSWIESTVLPEVDYDLSMALIKLPYYRGTAREVIQGVSEYSITRTTIQEDGSIKYSTSLSPVIKNVTNAEDSDLSNYRFSGYITIKDNKIVSYQFNEQAWGATPLATFLDPSAHYVRPYLPTEPGHPATKKYVDDTVASAIAGVAQFSLLPVDTLPTEDIKTNIIYAVPSDDPKEKDVRIEYVYINDDWEIVGTTKIDLSNYYTKAEIDAKIAELTTLVETSTATATAEEVADILNGTTSEEEVVE